MIIGTVVGSVVSTQKFKELSGFKLLKVKTEDGGQIVAADTLGAGIGETVLVSRGCAAQVILEKPAPIDALVVGIIDAGLSG